jgi:3-oxoacyl-[acyl-carrier-protein] synthase-3
MIQASRNVGIVGIGSCVPEKILTNFDLEKMVETSDEWIKTRTGIEQRRIAGDDEATSDLAFKAAQKALEDADMTPDEIDLIVVATISPDMYTPSTACIVQAKLGASRAAAFDINAACTGFAYGITVASQFILTGYYGNALVIGADKLSSIVDWKDRSTCILFGDGAGAVVLKTVENGYGILSTNIGADGTLGMSLTAPSCHISLEEKEKRNSENSRTIRMDGSEVFKFAVRVLVNATNNALEDLNLKIDDVDLIVPHQANIRIIDAAAKRLGVSSEKIYSNISRFGNMSAASIPIALDDAVREGRIKKGDLLVLVGFGGGLTWGSAVVKWCK